MMKGEGTVMSRGSGAKASRKSHLDMLKRRRDFLRKLIDKQGKDASSWDRAEHAALCWAIEELS
jgi:hypothetical protein